MSAHYESLRLKTKISFSLDKCPLIINPNSRMNTLNYDDNIKYLLCVLSLIFSHDLNEIFIIHIFTAMMSQCITSDC